MKLKQFENLGSYNFIFIFENGEKIKKNIKELISPKVALEELETARIDEDWGCLEFKNGMIDIEPKTLYKYLKINNRNDHI
jgi:hypothetical protein